MPKVHSTYVPSVGNEDADIMFVGEAPGKTEEREREPFVGKSGKLLTQYAERHGIRRPDEMFLTNLCKYRPRRNSFKNLIDTPQLEEGLAELEEEIRRVDPNLIVALGGWPLYHLTGQSTRSPGSGITSYRGSLLPCTLVEGYKVLATVHPAFVLRVWTQHPIFDFDLRYASEQMQYPELIYPEYTEYIAGSDTDHENWISDAELGDLVSEMAQAEWLSVDIETFKDQTMSCCGFADGTDRSLVITFQRKGGWQWVKNLLASPAKKIMQYGTYDRNFLLRFYNFESEGFLTSYKGWDGEDVEITNLGWDTYVAAATLMPEFPRGLDFLASVYTDFPYYKDDRKEWKKDYDLDILWSYNAKDVIATYTIAAKQMKELSELWDFDVPAQFAEV